MSLRSPVLIGRGDLLALAGRRLDEAAESRGGLLFLAGEAGIGKTRLLYEISARAAAAGFTVVTAAAAPGDAEVAAGLLADLGAGLRRAEATAVPGERIGRRLREPAGDDPDRQRRLLVTDLAELVEAAVTGPLLITCEDLHWADELSLDVLARLGRRARELPLLIAGTYRSDELYPRVPMRAWRTRLLTQRYAEEVRLPRLNPDETADLARAITGTSPPGLHARSDGIPLHVEEFLAAARGVPDTLADAVLFRAEQLGPRARAVAGAAAVLGRSFDPHLLTAIAGDTPERIDAALRELTERFFVQPGGDGTVYDFRHALIRDALYADLTPHRRRELHERAAEAAAGAGFPAAFLSDQYERAHRTARAHAYAEKAAAEAVALSAHREAAELYRRAERTLDRGAAPAERATLLAALAAELAATDDNGEADAAYAEAYRIRIAAGEASAAAALLPGWVAVRHLLGDDLERRTAMLRGGLPLAAGHPEIRAGLHAALAAAYMLDRRLDEALEDGATAREHGPGCELDATVGSVLLFAGRLDEGLTLLEGAVRQATEQRLEGPAARAYRMLGSSCSVLVEYDRAERWLREGIAYADRVERFNDRHYMTAHLAHVLWATGARAEAETQARLALADGRGGITTRITALHVLGYLALARDAAEARALLTEAADLGTGMAELQRVSPAWWGLAELALQSGDTTAAVAWCERGWAASAPVSDAAYLFPYAVTGTRAQLSASGPTAAREWIDRLAGPLTARAIPGTLGALGHARGLIHLAEGQTGKARTELDRAARFWSARRRVWEGTAALLDQARCAHRSRRPAEAATLAAEARAVFGDPLPPGWSTAYPPPPRSTTPVLTARELEVARLIAAGHTDRVIAGLLTISPRTVSAHVEHIRAKLGVSKRTQIAGWLVTVEPPRSFHRGTSNGP
ncbi:AAA family ATPase [Actinoplanes sp. NPDC051851]|uniref:helix-turn-helix transcriptional regulator n=1 Tax=Actinoplanes sp. NPDC051851 TaxID=3154753 RepID=UPI00341FC5C7